MSPQKRTSLPEDPLAQITRQGNPNRLSTACQVGRALAQGPVCCDCRLFTRKDLKDWTSMPYCTLRDTCVCADDQSCQHFE